MPSAPTKQTIASEQKRLNGRTFALSMIRTPKPPPSPSPKAPSASSSPSPPTSTKTSSPNPTLSKSSTRSRKTGILSGLQEIRLHQLHQTALSFSLPPNQGHKDENPLIAAINETLTAGRLERVEGLGRVEYEAVERRLELFITRRGGRMPSRE